MGPHRRSVLASFLLVVAPAGLFAQTLNLRDLLTNFLAQGVTLAPPAVGISHVAHFSDPGSPQFLAVEAFNSQIATQLSNFPLASSGGGFTYRVDPDLGVLVRSTDSFGPVYTERADTIGKGRFNFGINYSSFTFDSIDGLGLRNGDLKLVFTHEPIGNPTPFFFEGDVITANLGLKVTTNITAFEFNYGLLDNFDMSLAVPIVNVEMKAVATDSIQRLATGVCCAGTHQFVGGGATSTTQVSGSATGLGDILARLKYRMLHTPEAAVAILGDVRVPTGNADDLLGTGVTQLRGAVIGSFHFNPVSVHLNGGYTWASEKDGVKVVPNAINYAAGVDVAVHPRFTLAAEFLGRDLENTNKVVIQNHTYTANQLQADLVTSVPVSATFPRMVVQPLSWQNQMSVSVGLKVNPVGNLLLTLNGLIPVNHNGLTDKFTPLVGLDYSF